MTSNKELVAAKGAELLKIAQEKNVNFLFEASVGGGIPIIRPISQCLAANDVIEIAGILNGTTNFILTKMIRENMKFEDALALAQKLGYAERNPAADIEGADAAGRFVFWRAWRSASTYIRSRYILRESRRLPWRMWLMRRPGAALLS